MQEKANVQVSASFIVIYFDLYDCRDLQPDHLPGGLYFLFLKRLKWRLVSPKLIRRPISRL
jgi:hypothetical protein